MRMPLFGNKMVSQIIQEGTFHSEWDEDSGDYKDVMNTDYLEELQKQVKTIICGDCYFYSGRVCLHFAEPSTFEDGSCRWKETVRPVHPVRKFRMLRL